MILVFAITGDTDELSLREWYYKEMGFPADEKAGGRAIL